LNLKRELEDLNVGDTSQGVSGEAPSGAKGEPVALGLLVLTILPVLIPSVANFLQHWVTEGRRVVLEAPNGAKLEFVPGKKLTDSELITWLEKLNSIPTPEDYQKPNSAS
jgi:hypothetical protein